ncbi:CerR family C-terminal domain-containing protein [Neoaquamicrobium sediminum]|uniref:CerR family C-terminal domain-containing protein n=1 Tax=Neoaquamicrobium sediminum TaxID=1849104 RepID=UPI00361EB378
MKSDSDASGASRSAESTRAALIEAGLKLFGEKGYAATSTREIAAKAEANIGSIAYHFGGKEALRDACAEHIVKTVRGFAEPAIMAAPLPADASAAEEQLCAAIQRISGFLLASPETAGFVRFILRELQYPTTALDIIYHGVFEPVHKLLCRFWATATGEDAESEDVKIAVFTMIGQLVYFRIGREAVMRRLNWAELGQDETQKITQAVAVNIKAAIAARRSMS